MNMMSAPTLSASQSSQQPESAEKLVFRSTRDQKMKGSINLAACLDGLATERLASELAPQRGHALTLYAGQVTFLGALALQLLIAANRQWQTDGKPFRIADPSAAFLEGVALLGSNVSDLGIDGLAEGTQ
jgi:chemotaxis protein CheX